MEVAPPPTEQRFLDTLDRTMRFETLSATNKATVTKKMIEVLQSLSEPSRFDNYIDVMQQYIDLADKIVSEGLTEPAPKFGGQGWTAEIDMLFRHLNAFIDNIKKLTEQWMGVDYKTKYDVDFLGPLKELDVKTRIGYNMSGYDTPPYLIPLFEDLKTRLVRMTENDTISTNEVEKARNVWMVCKILQDRAIFIANSLVDAMEKIAIKNHVVVPINLKEIITFAQSRKGGRRTRHKKRSGNKNKKHSRSKRRSSRRH